MSTQTHDATKPSARSEGESGQASHIYPARDLRGHSHLPGPCTGEVAGKQGPAASASQVCAPGPVLCTCSTQGLSQVLLGGKPPHLPFWALLLNIPKDLK